MAHHQADTWGAPAEPIEELDFRNDPPARYIAALEAALGVPQEAEYTADSNDLRNFVAYHAEHVLPHLAGNLTTYPPTARFAYIGANPRMFRLAARCIAELGFTHPLFDAGVATAPEILLANYDLLIFDFGLDPSNLKTTSVARVTDWPRDQRYHLGDVAKCLEACAERADTHRSHIPDFLVVNANHHIFRQFCGQFLLLSETPFATHVRKGRPRIGDERLYRSHLWKYVEDEMRSFFGYGTWENAVPRITLGQSIDFTSAGRSSPYKDGNWGAMDFTGTWIEGHTAAILFAPPERVDDDLIAFIRVNEAFIGPEDDPIRVRASFEGEELARWTLFTRYGITVCKILLPARLVAGKAVCRIALHVENPQSAQRVADALGQKTIGHDPRELGIKVQQIAFTNKDPWRYSLGETLDFTERGSGIEHADECWTQPDELGAWTIGPDAGIVFWPRETTTIPVAATFTINNAANDDDHPDMEASVAVNGRTGRRVDQLADAEHPRSRRRAPRGMLPHARPHSHFVAREKPAHLARHGLVHLGQASARHPPPQTPPRTRPAVPLGRRHGFHCRRRSRGLRRRFARRRMGRARRLGILDHRTYRALHQRLLRSA